MRKLLDRGLGRLMPLTLALGLASIGVAGLTPGETSTHLRPVATITTVIPVSTWTVVNSAAPTTSYWTSSFYRQQIRVGHNGDDNSTWRALLQADISSLQGRAISSAYFRITLDHSWSCAPTPAALYALNSTISPSAPVTWATSAGYWGQQLDIRSANANGTGACGIVQPDYIMNFSGGLTISLGTAVTNNNLVYTMGLRSPNEASSSEFKKFLPTNIELVVTYID
jgi:hypothetical protein